jgi:predicted DNA-binding ribbon-helix-helix protein
MAFPSAVTQKGHSAVAKDAVRQQVNNLTASLRVLCTKLDADAGVTDTTYGSLITDSTIATAPAIVNQ